MQQRILLLYFRTPPPSLHTTKDPSSSFFPDTPPPQQNKSPPRPAFFIMFFFFFRRPRGRAPRGAGHPLLVLGLGLPPDDGGPGAAPLVPGACLAIPSRLAPRLRVKPKVYSWFPFVSLFCWSTNGGRLLSMGPPGALFFTVSFLVGRVPLLK